MKNHEKVDSYGWSRSEPPSHAYLEPVIGGLLKQVQTRRVLDLGCGNGSLCNALIKAGFDCVGCDADSEGVEIARKKNPGAVIVDIGVYDDPAQLDQKEFDAVVSAEVIEHLFKPRFLPKFARAVLREGGYLIVTTPYHGYLKNLILSIFDKWDAHHTVNWEGGHIKFWSRQTLSQLLINEGFAIEAFKGVGRMPYLWKSMVIVAKKL